MGDIGVLVASDGTTYDVSVLGVGDEKTFDVNLPANLVTANLSFIIRRGISKVLATNLPNLSKVSANLQNVYTSLNHGLRDAYVISPSLPDYFNTPIVPKDQSVLFSGQFNGFELNIGSNPFYSGDPIWYSANNNIPLNIPEGQYYVKRLMQVQLVLQQVNQISEMVFL